MTAQARTDAAQADLAEVVALLRDVLSDILAVRAARGYGVQRPVETGSGPLAATPVRTERLSAPLRPDRGLGRGTGRVAGCPEPQGGNPAISGGIPPDGGDDDINAVW
jgi:hypothetical protein